MSKCKIGTSLVALHKLCLASRHVVTTSNMEKALHHWLAVVNKKSMTDNCL